MCLGDCIHMYEWEIGVRASYVAVVIVVVGVDASLIPVNGLQGLNRRGAFLWDGSIIHPLHSCPSGKRRGSGTHWHGRNASRHGAFPFLPSASRHPGGSLFLLPWLKQSSDKAWL